MTWKVLVEMLCGWQKNSKYFKRGFHGYHDFISVLHCAETKYQKARCNSQETGKAVGKVGGIRVGEYWR